VIDHDGVIVKRFIGAVDWDLAAHRELFRRLLAAADTGPPRPCSPTIDTLSERVEPCVKGS
jgi:hypothetical protein